MRALEARAVVVSQNDASQVTRRASRRASRRSRKRIFFLKKKSRRRDARDAERVPRFGVVVRDVDVRHVVSRVPGIKHVARAYSAVCVLRARDEVGVLGARADAAPEIEGRRGAHRHEIHVAAGETSARQDLLAERRERGPRGGGDARRGRPERGCVRRARVRVRVNTGVVARVSRGRCEKRPGPRVRPRGVRVAGGRNARVALRVVVAGDRHADVRASDQRKRFDAHVASERIGGCVVAVWGSARREETERRFFLDEPVSEGEPSHENAYGTSFQFWERPKSYDTFAARKRGHTAARGAAASARWARISGVTMVG